jgi:predicted negative regulator of RcsB-dependent stress response
VDQQTKAALKQDKFVNTTTHSLEWASENRQRVIAVGSLILTVLIVVVTSVVVYNMRTEAASLAFGQAMQVYQAPLTQPGEAASTEGTQRYSSVADRAKAASAAFQGVADKYGMTPVGRNARYFAGLTDIEAGQKQQAEDALKQVAGSWDSNLASLAKLALAGLYHDTGRDPEAIDLLNQLAAKPTSTVPYGLSELQLGELYQSEGKADDARKVYASLQDKDAKGAAGAIAKEKLNPATVGQPAQEQ